MAKDKYTFDDIGDLIGAVVGTAMMTQARSMMLSKEKKGEAFKNALQPYLNRQNIGLLLNDKNVEFIRTAIINGLPKLDKHYLVHAEPTADNKDIVWQLSYRPEGGKDALVLPYKKGYLSQITAEQLIELITKFIPENGTGNIPATA